MLAPATLVALKGATHSSGSSAITRQKPTLILIPGLRSTTEADRQGLQTPKTRDSNPAAVRLVALEGEHRKKAYGLALAAITRAPPEQRAALCAILKDLDDPQGAITLLSLLLDRWHGKLKVADVESLPRPSHFDAAAFARRLVFWSEHREAAEALAGMREPVCSMLIAAFCNTTDKEISRLASEYIAATRTVRGGWSVIGFLKAMGSPSGDAALEELARRRRAQLFRESNPKQPLPDALVDDAVMVEKIVSRKPHASWKDLRDDNARGILAELVRVEAVRADPKYSGKMIVRGLSILEAEGHERTEVDVAVFEARDGKLVPLLFENVKAGFDCAHDARHQNKVAIGALLDPSTQFVLPNGEEITARIDRGAEPETRTVGPLDDPSYDVALPATASDLIQVVARLQSR